METHNRTTVTFLAFREILSDENPHPPPVMRSAPFR